jgi:hypothetical protein
MTACPVLLPPVSRGHHILRGVNAQAPVEPRENGTLNMLRVVEHPSDAYADLRTTLDDLLRQGALTMLQQALEAEVEEYVARHVAAQGARRRSQGVRKGKAAPRLVTGTGGPDIRLPQSNDRQAGAPSEGQRFTSAILPKYVQQAPKVTEL